MIIASCLGCMISAKYPITGLVRTDLTRGGKRMKDSMQYADVVVETV